MLAGTESLCVTEHYSGAVEGELQRQNWDRKSLCVTVW